jgi:hypothetical protein
MKEMNAAEQHKYKIVADDNFPFFNAYHDTEYIDAHDRRSSISVSEQNMQYTLKNSHKREIVLYKIDNGLITGDELKCDFGIYTENDILYLVELKSPEREYGHALQQIINTIKILLKSKKISVSQLNARVVLKKYPALPSVKERKLERSIIETFNCDLQHGSKSFAEVLV